MGGVKVIMKGVGGNLALASGITMTLMFGMVLVLCLGVYFIVASEDPVTGLGICIGITLAFDLVAFFIALWMMDLAQKWLYGIRWVDMTELEGKSPETPEVIRRVCSEKKLKQPRLGIRVSSSVKGFSPISTIAIALNILSRFTKVALKRYPLIV